jgi:membrane-associated phospholipid phosphatase
MVLIAATESRSSQRVIVVAVGVCFILGIALFRIILGVHSVREVAVGLAIGTGTLALFGRGYLRHRPATAWPVWYVTRWRVP